MRPEELALKAVREALRRTVFDPDAWTHVTVVSDDALHVHILTNQRKNVEGKGGRNRQYLEGYAEGYLAAHGHDVEVRVSVVGAGLRDETEEFRYLPLKRALREGVIEEGSPVHRVCERLGIEYVVLGAREIVGPNPALVEVVEGLEGERAVDVFTGTGAGALAAVEAGFEEVYAIDLEVHPEVRERLESEGVEVIEADFHDVDLREFEPIDLLTADPPYASTLEFLEKLSEERPRIDTAVVCHGFSSWTRAVREIRGFLIELFEDVEPVSKYGHELSVCRRLRD
ncbi:class I SAM-dependent methyltransferase [Methanopyrus kandleri]